MNLLRSANAYFKKDNLTPSALAPNGKLKQKIWVLSALLLFTSSLLIDLVNARAGSRLNWVQVLVENIPLVIPWGLAFLIASRYRDFLKIFTPLYLALVLLIATGSLAFDRFTQAQNLEEKFAKELKKIFNDNTEFLDGAEYASQSLSRPYSSDEYGHLAVYLNEIRKWTLLFKQENATLIQAFSEVGLDETFTDEVLFNFFNILDKKRKLEKVSLFLEESSKRTEDIYSEYVSWLFTSPEVDKNTRKNFAKAISTSPEEKKFFRQEGYRIKKNIVQEYIALLSVLSNAYGSYWMEDGHLIFANAEDLEAWESHYEAIKQLAEEEENFATLFQRRAKRLQSEFSDSH